MDDFETASSESAAPGANPDGMRAELVSSRWPNLTIKLVIDGKMHVLRWRRGLFRDEVRFDDKVVGTAEGMWGRETLFGLVFPGENDDGRRTLLTVDPRAEYDWGMQSWRSSDMSAEVAGVRLETDQAVLLRHGTLAEKVAPERPWGRFLDGVFDFADDVTGRVKARTRRYRNDR